MLARGFRLLGERVEFKTDVAELPTEDGTPLTWRSLDAVGLEFAAAMMSRTAEGDPTGRSEREARMGLACRAHRGPHQLRHCRGARWRVLALLPEPERAQSRQARSW